MTDKRKAAYSFLVLLGVISLFSDLTYEGARSILGPYCCYWEPRPRPWASCPASEN